MADSKLTALDALTAVEATDLLYVVDDPGGSPVGKKATAQDVLAVGWKRIAVVTLADAAASIALTSIPAARMLYLEMHGRSSATGDASVAVTGTFNSDTDNNYRNTHSTSTLVGFLYLGDITGSQAGNTSFSFAHAWISNIASMRKHCLARSASTWYGTSPMLYEHVGHWVNNSDAISSINMALADGSNFIAGTQVYLYGMTL